MSKSSALDSLLESAITQFSEHGYAGASLRNIANGADVPLSTIHFYFKSKSALFLEVRRHAWKEIDEDRNALLDKLLLQTTSVDMRDIVSSLSYPIVRRAFSENRRDRDLIFVVRHFMSISNPGSELRMLDRADRTVERWIGAMMECCPAFTREDAIWAFSFMIGAIYSWQLIDHRYDRMIGAKSSQTMDRVNADIVEFCCSGIHAMAALRTPRA